MRITCLLMQIRTINSNVYMTVYSSAYFKLEICYQINYILIFCHGSTVLVGLGLLIVEVSISHSDTSHSVGLLSTSDQPISETTTWQHTTNSTDRHPCTRRDLNSQFQRADGARPTLQTARPPGSSFIYLMYNFDRSMPSHSHTHIFHFSTVTT
jgi:hypothetical protein